MKIDRREFIKKSAVFSSGIFLLLNSSFSHALDVYKEAYNSSLQKVIDLIAALKKEGSNIVKKVMNGKKYHFDPYFHYPYDGGIVDETTGCRVFFHCHRKNEYGHFHTFYKNEKGELIHLVMISMKEVGEPIQLATVNSWVTGDKYYKSEILKKYFENYKIEQYSFKEKRVVRFVTDMFDAYREEIFKLFDDRDKWIRNYAGKYFREPFEDRDYEVLSSVKVDIFKDRDKIYLN